MSTNLRKRIESAPSWVATRVFVYGLAGALAAAVVGMAVSAPAQEPARILWTNRGNDGFEQFQDPAAARAVVDDAIAAWEAVIQRFNYHGP
jgi:hypothetical protein